MSKKPIVLAALLLTLAAPGSVMAQSVTPSPSPLPSGFIRQLKGDRREMFKNVQEAAKKAREDAREARENEREARLTSRPLTPTPTGTVTPGVKKAKFTVRLNDVYNRLLKQLEARYNQLLASKTKIQIRINDAKAAGKNVTETQAKLDTFSTAQYNTDLAAFKAEYAKLSASANPGQELGALRSAGAKVSQDLNAMRNILSDSLRLLMKAAK
jgi:hypothetical protein